MNQYEHLLLDGRNAIYRAVYAALSDDEFTRSNNDCSIVFFRFLASYINKYRTKNVHIFWDAPKETLWRKKIYQDYKAGRDISHSGRYQSNDVRNLVDRCTMIVRDITSVSNCVNYYAEKQEADDLIYAFSRLNVGHKMIIVSSDGDFKQIPYMMRNIDVYNPLSKDNGLVNIDYDFDPVELKCYAGEHADNIVGYPKIGPKRARLIISDKARRNKLFEDFGRKIYLTNRLLIDLAMCPFLFNNLCYIQRTMMSNTNYDEPAIRSIIQKYKVKGLLGEMSRTILPLKFIKREGDNGC